MNNQNSFRRTMISFFIMIFLSVLSWSIQYYTENQSEATQPLEASGGHYENERLMHQSE